MEAVITVVKKNDLCLIAALAAFALILCGLQAVFSKGGGTVTVIQDGENAAVYSLSSNQEITFYSEDGGYNILIIKDNEAYISDSDCPDKLCRQQGRIRKNGESIVCLPHRLVIEITEGEPGEVDAIAR